MVSSGTVIWQTESVYNSAGQLSYSIGQHAPEEDGARTDYYYDAYGRQVAVLGPEETVAGYANPIRLLTQYAYNSQGQQSSVTTNIAVLNTTTNFSAHPDLTPALVDDTDAQETSYEYNAFGQRTSLTDPEGNTTTWVYNDLGQVIAETNELNDTEYYAYDSFGRLASKTNRNGRVTTYTCDAYGRLLAENWLDSQSNVIETIAYTYTSEGYLYTASDSSATYTYSYDAYGYTTSITIAIVGLTPTVVLAQQYDGFGNRIQLAANVGGTDDFVNDYVYGALGLLVQVEQYSVDNGNAVAEKRADFAYNADSMLATLTRYADTASNDLVVCSTYGYDLVGRITSLTHAKGETTLASYTWTYDANGNLTQEVSSIDGTVDYTADAVGQLIVADYDGAQTDESYVYDENGNRVTANGASYATGANNQLLCDGTYCYAYDGEGNRTAKFVDADQSGTITDGDSDITTYSWDHRNRLTQVNHYSNYTAYDGQSPDKVAQYVYDYLNRLVEKILDSNGDGTTDSVTVQVYDGDQVVLEFEHSGTGNATASNLSHRYLWGQAVDQLLADEKVTDLQSPGDILCSLTDHLGTVRDLAAYDAQNDVTSIANHRVYNSYGELQSETNAAVDCIFGYTGRQFDEDTGLQNNLNRWYDPAVGRWISEDPMGFDAGDANLFRYVANKPMLAVDPTGTMLAGQLSVSQIQTRLNTLNLSAVRFVNYTVRHRVAQAFASGGTAIGRWWNELGQTVQNFARQLFNLIPRLTWTPNNKIGQQKVIDFALNVGSKIANLEVKYKLPARVGDALTRLVGQMNAMVSQSGQQAVVWTLKEPTMAEMNLLQRTAGADTFNRVQFVHGVTGLYQWIVHYFGL